MGGRFQPALLGGLFIGVVSALPVVGGLNVCCCLWVVVGGGLTVYLQQQRTPMPLDTGEAVLGGLIAGLIGGVVSAIGNALVMSIMGPMSQEAMRQALENPEVPEQVREFMSRLATGEGMFVLTLALYAPVYAVFSTLGALLGLAIFRKKTPPMAPPPVAPPPPPPQVV